MSATSAGYDFGSLKIDFLQSSGTLTNVAFFRWGHSEVIVSKEMVLSTFICLRWALCMCASQVQCTQKFSAFNYWH